LLRGKNKVNSRLLTLTGTGSLTIIIIVLRPSNDEAKFTVLD
jgi:hypothetical protein